MLPGTPGGRPWQPAPPSPPPHRPPHRPLTAPPAPSSPRVTSRGSDDVLPGRGVARFQAGGDLGDREPGHTGVSWATVVRSTWGRRAGRLSAKPTTEISPGTATPARKEGAERARGARAVEARTALGRGLVTRRAVTAAAPSSAASPPGRTRTRSAGPGRLMAVRWAAAPCVSPISRTWCPPGLRKPTSRAQGRARLVGSAGSRRRRVSGRSVRPSSRSPGRCPWPGSSSSSPRCPRWAD